MVKCFDAGDVDLMLGGYGAPERDGRDHHPGSLCFLVCTGVQKFLRPQHQ